MSRRTLSISCGGSSFNVPVGDLVQTDLFSKNPKLLRTPYKVKHSDNAKVFAEFVRSLAGEQIDVTRSNSADLLRLATEFGFAKVLSEVEAFLRSDPDAALYLDVESLSFSKRNIEHHLATVYQHVIDMQARMGKLEDRLDMAMKELQELRKTNEMQPRNVEPQPQPQGASQGNNGVIAIIILVLVLLLFSM